MNTNIVLRAARLQCSERYGLLEEFVSLLYPFSSTFTQQRSALCTDPDQGSDSDAQKTIKYDFDLLERNCLVQKLPQKTDVTFVRLDILNLDKYVG